MSCHKLLAFGVVLSILFLRVPAQAQSSQAAAPQAPKLAPIEHTTDEPDLLRETQLGIREASHVGLVWWVPFEFWIDAGLKRGASAEKTSQELKVLKDYTVVMIFAAEISSLGSFNFISPADLQKKTFLRDSAGNEYSPVAEPAQDAQTLAAVIRPILAGGMGKAGENAVMLFFPARGKNGSVVADAKSSGNFSIVIKDVLGSPESVYSWRLPLTTVMAPRYCPVGKERMKANWQFCPWHGVKLAAAQP